MKMMWKVLLFYSCCCAVSMAQAPEKSRLSGFSDQYRSENTLGEYTFGYNEDHTSGGSFRRESSDRFGNKIGSYGLRIGDGRVRVVNYVADENGFRADVVSNEPGIESQDSNEFLKITKKNIYKILVPGFRYASEAPYLTFETDQSSSSFRDNVKYDLESSRVTYGNDQSPDRFSDDVKYAPELAGATIEADQSSSSFRDDVKYDLESSRIRYANDQSPDRFFDNVKYTPELAGIAIKADQLSSSFSDDVSDEAGLQYDSGDSNLGTEGNMFFSQDGNTGDAYSGEEGRSVNINPNVEDSYVKAFSEDTDRSDDFYSNEEIFDDGYDDDEYRRASETAPQNDTRVEWQVQKESDGVATNTGVSVLQPSIASRKNVSSLLQEDGNKSGNRHEKSIVNDDLHAHQSKVSIVKSLEHVAVQDTKNSTETMQIDKYETPKRS